MNQDQNFSTQPKLPGSLVLRVIYGAGIALLFIAVFLIGAESKPGWSQYWMLRPLIIVPVAGAFGGIFFHYMGIARSKGGMIKALALLFSFIGYMVIVWLGIVLGLDGTLWD